MERLRNETRPACHPRRQFSRMVSGRGRSGRPRGNLSGARLHDHQAVGLGNLGAGPGLARQAHQGNRPRELLFPAVHSHELHRPGGEPCGGLRQGNGGGDASPAQGRRRQAGGRSGVRARRAPRRAPDLGDHHRRRLPALGLLLSRPADPHQSMGQCRALGNAHPHVPAHHRIPVAGGPYRPRRQGRRAGRNAEDARSLSRAGRGRAGHAGGGRREARERAFPGRGFDLLDRGDDAGRQGPAGRHLALSRDQFRARPRTSATSRRPANWNSATRRRGACPRGSSAASS